jgi:hypothetical protein
MMELKELEDERESKREMYILQIQAEREMKTRIVRDYFKNLYSSLEFTQEDITINEDFIRQVLNAIEALIRGEGDVEWVEKISQERWLENTTSINYDKKAFHVAK